MPYNFRNYDAMYRVEWSDSFTFPFFFVALMGASGSLMKLWLAYSLCSFDINMTIAVIIHVFGVFLHFDLDSCYIAMVNVMS